MNVFPKGIADLFYSRYFLLIRDLGVENPMEILFIFGMPQEMILSVGFSNKKREVGPWISGFHHHIEPVD
jgi:hypothetical protein